MLPDRALAGLKPDSVQITLLKVTQYHVPDTAPFCGGGFHLGNDTPRETEDTQDII